jgi:MFS family permease
MSGYLGATFRSLRHRAYRLYFTGQIVSTVGTWAQKVAQAWLVLELTGSGTLLGVTVGLQQVPTLFLTPWAGTIADRIDRRVMLLWTNWAAAVPAAAMGVLVLIDRATVPAIMLLAVLIGVVEAFDKPVRHTFAADIVPTEDVTNAVALNATMFNAGKILGPAAAGLAISSVGVAATFLFNVVSFLIMILALSRIRAEEIRPRDIRPKERGALRTGVGYARRTPVIATALMLMTVTGLVAYEWNTAVPLLARDFSPDAAMIGYFFAAMGTGAVVGSLSLAGILVAAPRTFLAAGGAFAVALGLVSLAPSAWLAMAAMVLLGAVATTFRALATSLVQLESDPALRGRMVSLLIMAINGTSPISGPLIGWMSETYGARVAIGIGAAVSLVATLASWRYLARAVPRELSVSRRGEGRTYV